MDITIANSCVLTSSDIDVLQQLADGHTINEIAKGKRKQGRIYQRLYHIRQKLEARHTLHAVATAIRRGYIKIEPNIADRQEAVAIIVCICSKNKRGDLEAALAELQRTGKILLSPRSLVPSLTQLEIQTLQLLADGKKSREVAQMTSKRRRSKERSKRLDWITEKRLKSIREKLHAQHNAHAIRIAMELGLIW
ncbi:MAG: hypothetical protein QXQ33_05535, partial [Nitrososphaerota archaeon]